MDELKIIAILFGMTKPSKCKYLFVLILSCLLISSCFASAIATKEDNKDIKSIIKDGSFLYFNYFDDAEIVTDENAKTVEHTLKLRADEDYAYNIIKITEDKNETAGFRNVSYKLMLDQSKGVLVVEGKYKTEDTLDGYVTKDIIEKLVASTDEFKKVVLNQNALKPSSVSMDIF